MTNSTLATRALEVTYEDVRTVLYDLVHKFRRRYGGDFGELVSDANAYFMQAYATYNGDRGSAFSTWFYYRTWRRMLSDLRQRRSQSRRRLYLDNEVMGCYAAKQYNFNMDEFAEGLSQDAKKVVGLIVCPPLDIKLSCGRRGDHNSALHYRRAMCEYLKDIGWPRERIMVAFAEISNELTSRSTLT